MEQETIKIVTEQIDKLAVQLGVAKDVFWPVIVRQQYIEAFWSLVIFIISIASLVFVIEKRQYFEDIDDDTAIIVLTFAGIFCLFSTFVFIMMFPHAINPEYYALKDLMEMIKP